MTQTVGPERSTAAANSILEADSLYRDRYYVRKSTGTFSEVLLAYGFAALICEIGRQSSPQTGLALQLIDDGPWYQVRLSQPLQRQWIEQCRWFSGAKAIRTQKAQLGPLPEGEIEDYNRVWGRIKAYLGSIGSEGADSARSDAATAQEDLAALDPQDWLTVYIGTRQMQALSIYNRAVLQWWITGGHFAANLKAVLAAFDNPSRDLGTVAAAWKRSVPVRIKTELTASQMFNPHQGKGQNRAKANALAMENMGSFWVSEYLKAVGAWQCCVPRRVRDSDDYKTYVVTPVHLSLEAHRRVFPEFREKLWADTAVKMDCTASLLYTDLLLKHSEGGQYDELAELLGRKSVREIVAGFHVAQYKMLSRNAYTMINLGFLELPVWIDKLASYEQAMQVRGVLEEHRNVLRGIEEDRSEGYALLTCYRRFLSSGQWDDFFDFASGFASYLMRELDEARKKKRDSWQKSLTTNHLEVMLMQDKDKTLLSIVQNNGFRGIARAIRKSTVTLQYMLRDQSRSQLPYEIRYGLAQEFLRKANRNDEFVQAVASFAQSYDAENARIAEQAAKQKKEVWRRDAITDQDLDEMVRLVEDHGAETVAHLLVAYGYARESRGDAAE